MTEALLTKMGDACFKKCAGTSGDKLDKREQSCLANCQDVYLETMQQVQQTLMKRQNQM